jgi:hypothetical protein
MLLVRLIEMGRSAECIESRLMKQFGTLKAAAVACTLLVRNGIIVVATNPKLRPEGPRLDVEAAVHDTADFAAEKIIDDLAAAGILALDAADYSPEEEEQIKKRLADLGYIE